MEEEITAIQQLINTAIEFCVNYSFQVIGALAPRDRSKERFHGDVLKWRAEILSRGANANPTRFGQTAPDAKAQPFAQTS